MAKSNKLKRSVIPIVNINTKFKLGCAWEKTWIDTPSYQYFCEVVGATGVIIMSAKQWVLTQNLIPCYKTVVITPGVTVLNKLGIHPDICVGEDEVWNLWDMYPELINRPIFLLGGEATLEEAYEKCNTVYHIESDIPTLNISKLMKYKLELVSNLFEMKALGTYLHVNRKNAFTISKGTRKKFSRMGYKHLDNEYHRYCVEQLYSSVVTYLPRQWR